MTTSGWRPMETAPKDGTLILVISQYGKDVSVVRWDPGDKTWICFADGFKAIAAQSDFGTEYRTVDDAIYWQSIIPPGATPRPRRRRPGHKGVR